MLRRSFLKWLGITPVVVGNLRAGPKGQGGNDNPNKLPVVKFDKNQIINLNQLIGNTLSIRQTKNALVWVRKEDKVMVPWLKSMAFGELKIVVSKILHYHKPIPYPVINVYLLPTDNSKTIDISGNFSHFIFENNIGENNVS